VLDVLFGQIVSRRYRPNEAGFSFASPYGRQRSEITEYHMVNRKPKTTVQQLNPVSREPIVAAGFTTEREDTTGLGRCLLWAGALMYEGGVAN
jgi:hypothetical protein